MSRRIEITCTMCGRVTKDKKDLVEFGGIGTGSKPLNIKLGFETMDLCPECLSEISCFINKQILENVNKKLVEDGKI